MNICLISREFPPFFGGGIGTYTRQWAHALANSGHTAVVVTVSDDGREHRETQGGVNIVRLPFLRGSGYEADWSAPHPSIATPESRAAFAALTPVSAFGIELAKALPGVVAEYQIEVIEAPDTGALGWFALNSRRTRHIGGLPPIVTMLHSPTAWIAGLNLAPLRPPMEVNLAAMERDCVRWSDGLVSPTAALADWAARYWGISADVIDVIPHPLGDLEVKARQAAAKPRSPGPLRIVYAGRLEPRKGVDTLLEGFERATRAGLDATLDLAGEDMPDPSGGGKFGANSLSRMDPAARKRVVAHGRVSPERVEELRAAADVVAIPSPMDNFPYTCVEAMCGGRIVVAAAAGGMAEMIRDGREGLLFAPGDAAACAAALSRAAHLSSEAWAEMGQSAAARMLEMCGNERVVQQRIGHYRRVIARQSLPTRTPRRKFIVVNPGTAAASSIERLAVAAEAGGASFAHGWTRSPGGGVRAFASPCLDTLAASAREIGPVVVDASLAERDPAQSLMSGDSWSLAFALTAAGHTGIVVPDVVTDVEDEPLSRVEREAVRDLERRAAAGMKAVQELDRIKASTGWGLLQRCYAVLHILKGRGIKRNGAE